MSESKSSAGQNSSGPHKKRFGKQLTHFLCFPLLSEEILEPFGSSLEYFRSISTTPKREHPLKARQRREAERLQQSEAQNSSVPRDGASGEVSYHAAGGVTDHQAESKPDSSDPLGNISKATSETFEESLKIVPEISHRPLGTYHLTIGVMDLAEPGNFQKCEEIFNGLDLKHLLVEAEKGPPSGAKVARKWKHDNRQIQEEKGTPNNSSRPSDGEGILDLTTDTNIDSVPDPVPMHISLLGMGAFSSPRRARVLWAHPYEQTTNTSATLKSQANSATTLSRPSYDLPFPDRLYNFALHIEAPFRAAGLIKETRPLTLHATLVNIRHKMQPKGGRTSKGKAWTHGRKRWDESCIDASLLCTIFNEYSGNIKSAKDALGADFTQEQNEDDDESQSEQTTGRNDDRDGQDTDHSKQFLWAKDIPVDRVALCELGAKKSNNEQLELEYPPVLEKWI